jgi:hypothetical protein
MVWRCDVPPLGVAVIRILADESARSDGQADARTSAGACQRGVLEMALAFRVSRRIELARPDVPPSARQRRQTGPIGPGLKLEAVSDHVGRSTGRGHGTLYDRLGGRDAITAVVDDLLARCAATTTASG